MTTQPVQKNYVYKCELSCRSAETCRFGRRLAAISMGE